MGNELSIGKYYPQILMVSPPKANKNKDHYMRLYNISIQVVHFEHALILCLHFSPVLTAELIFDQLISRFR